MTFHFVMDIEGKRDWTIHARPECRVIAKLSGMTDFSKVLTDKYSASKPWQELLRRTRCNACGKLLEDE